MGRGLISRNRHKLYVPVEVSILGAVPVGCDFSKPTLDWYGSCCNFSGLVQSEINFSEPVGYIDSGQGVDSRIRFDRVWFLDTNLNFHFLSVFNLKEPVRPGFYFSEPVWSFGFDQVDLFELSVLVIISILGSGSMGCNFSEPTQAFGSGNIVFFRNRSDLPVELGVEFSGSDMGVISRNRYYKLSVLVMISIFRSGSVITHSIVFVSILFSLF